MNKLILLALAATALATNCTKQDQLAPGKEYYLRYLVDSSVYGKSAKDLYKAGFKNGIPAEAKYMGFTPSTLTSVYFKEDEQSKFTVTQETSKDGKSKGIRVYSTDSELILDQGKQKRIFSWVRGGAQNGYYMYQLGYDSTKDTDDTYSLLFYDDANVLSAAQYDASKPQELGVYDGAAVIYGTNKGGVATKFCFEEVGTAPIQIQCNAADIFDEVNTKHAEFKEDACKKKKKIDENEVCTATCKDGFYGAGKTQSWEYKCQNDKTFAVPDPAIQCLQKTDNDKAREKAIYNTLVNVFKKENIEVDWKDPQVTKDLKDARDWITKYSLTNSWTLLEAAEESMVKTAYQDYLVTLVAPKLKALGLSDDQKTNVTDWIKTEAQIMKYFHFLPSDVTEETVTTACTGYLKHVVREFLGYSSIDAAEQNKVDQWIESLSFSDLKDSTEESAKQAFEAFTMKQITDFLGSSNTSYGKKYRKEEVKEQEKILADVARALTGKDITQDTVDKAVEEYYKKNGAVQFGVFGALVCLLLLH